MNMHSAVDMIYSLILSGILLHITDGAGIQSMNIAVISGAPGIIPCLYDDTHKENRKYWCQGSQWISCSILAYANNTGKYSLTDYPAQSIFTVQWENLNPSDSGYYWCAVEIGGEIDNGYYLYLTVQSNPDVFVVSSNVSGHEGGDISVQCFYSSGYKNEVKQWCRYKDQSCYTVGRTNTSQNSSVQISDDGRRSFTVLMTGLRLTDFGWYYCSVGDLQVPVHLLVQRDNESKSMSESDDAGQFPSTCKNQTASKDSEDSKCSPNDPSDQMDWIFLLLYTAVPLLLLLMLVLVIWRLVQKHNGALTKRGPDICSVAEGQKAVTYDTVVFKKANKHEPNQVSISHSPEQFEVIYSTLNLHQ
ncbi:polymeric immunoglobulin receptor isoform X1 [Carassius gibelio]|uniref:polymeric immunoglobulin receptor isoform X1 n=1 Tax=Carassius gibelio TaxID=101364 RepID=UPI002279879E|nr:polymeric immunoglobulin receptor isoform X1 [Carassius gibelio]